MNGPTLQNFFVNLPAIGNFLNHIMEEAEKYNAVSLACLSDAVQKNSTEIHYGYVFSKIDSACHFAAAALTAPIHLIINIFLTVISAPAALFDEKSKKFCKNHAFRCLIDLGAMGIGLVGTFSPDSATYLFKNRVQQMQPLQQAGQQMGQLFGQLMRPPMNGNNALNLQQV
jgi:hypothetical protein